MASRHYNWLIYVLLAFLSSFLLFAFSCNNPTASPSQSKTPNPAISIRLDRIGVYDNREDILRGAEGEIYVYVAVYDKKKPAQKLRFPQSSGQYYKLAKNATIDINSIVFTTPEVGNNLGLTIVGYEDDGGGYEPLVYKALGAALEAVVSSQTRGISELFNLNLAKSVGNFMGDADDFLGTYEKTFSVKDNWGIGEYTDIACIDERGEKCLRLWFSILNQ